MLALDSNFKTVWMGDGTALVLPLVELHRLMHFGFAKWGGTFVHQSS
jgi:hypothetical protein